MNALRQQITRRTFSFLLPSAALVAQSLHGQAVFVPDRLVRDGDVWNANSESMKMGYVQGFLDAADSAHANFKQAVNELKSLSPVDREALVGLEGLWDYAGIRFPELLDELSSFYANPLNSAITWDRALPYLRDKMRGKPQNILAKELELERKLASTSAENNKQVER